MTRFIRIVAAGIFGCVMAAGSAAAQAAHQVVHSVNHNEPEAVIKGAPYSGEAITTVKLILYDGTKMERTVTARIFRDTMGRIRREQTVVGLEALDTLTDFRAVVTIMDPVGDVIYSLNPGSRTATRLQMSTGRRIGSIELEIQDTLAGAKTVRGTKVPPKWPIREEALGTKDIDGLSAVGTRTITTIPAGRVGNDRPIEVIDERWESTALKVLLRSLHRDPRSGDVEYALLKISRTEPAASLFTVPAGYTIAQVR